MKKNRTFLGTIVVIAILVMAIPARPQVKADTGLTSSYFDLPLCLPGVYKNKPADCLPLGASESAQLLSEKGIPYPQNELPAASPDYSLTELPVYVAKIEASSTDAVPVFRDLESARAGGPALRTLAPGPTRYVSMVNQVADGGRILVEMESGEWVQAKPLYSWTRFQGLVFSQTPKNDFGWVIDDIESYTAPGYNSPKTGKILKKYSVIQIYKTAQADGYDWYLIGIDEWVSSHKARKVKIDTNKPEGVTGERWIIIDLANYNLTAYENGELVFATIVATGRKPFYTRPGLFQIYKKNETVTMQDAYEADRSDYYLLEAVPWAMFYDRNTAIHGVYWPVVLGINQSHGCVNLAPGDANWLYHWAEEGDWVYVHDPSGETPTDPSYYGVESTGP